MTKERLQKIREDWVNGGNDFMERSGDYFPELLAEIDSMWQLRAAVRKFFAAMPFSAEDFEGLENLYREEGDDNE